MGAGELYFSTEQRLQWHPSVHEEVGRETLHYWFLTFAASYEWDLVRADLLALLESLQVYSFALYELMGDCDVLLRVWLPRGTASSFRVELRNRLQRFSLSEDVLYSVEEVVRHWPFASEGRGEIAVLEDGVDTPSLDLVAEANHKLLDRLGVEDQTLASLAEDGVIGPRNHSDDQVPGVKIVTLIKPIGDMETAQIRGLSKQIALALDAQDAIKQRSLYKVEGRAIFLLTCLVPKERFFAFRDDLVSAISPLLSAAGVRTNSYACASPRLLMFQDLIPSPGVRRAPVRLRSRRVEDLLKLEESTTLEVKGSAFTPLNEWLFKGEELKESTAFFHEGVLRAIVGFLNAEGGAIVIGALEMSRYSDRDMVAGAPTFKDIGGYMCAGILDPSYLKRGWDFYVRRIAEIIASNVSPDPTPLLTIQNDEVDGVVFCVIEVASGREAGWHYLKPRRGDGLLFPVRQGPRTLELEGVDADRYKERHR